MDTIKELKILYSQLDDFEKLRCNVFLILISIYFTGLEICSIILATAALITFTIGISFKSTSMIIASILPLFLSIISGVLAFRFIQSKEEKLIKDIIKEKRNKTGSKTRRWRW